MNTTEGERRDSRQDRAIQIAALCRLERASEGWIVPSQSGSGATYLVDPDAGSCTCPDYATRRVTCKHQIAVQIVIKRETTTTTEQGRTKVTTTETVTQKVTYTQDWHAYDAAQMHESERFVELLSDLCAGVEQPPQAATGRPRLPLSDCVFALALKTYSTVSGRRATGYIKGARDKGFIDCAPHYSSAFRRLESEDLTPILKALIAESARPLSSIEQDFAIDSTGFATNTYSRWFDHKWGKVRSEQQWIKLHLMTGVLTNTVTQAEATAYESADAPQLPGLLAATAQMFSVREVSADKAYSSKRNLRAIEATGATPYVPFKSGTTGKPMRNGQRDALWERMWHYYTFNRETFLTHYHKRSNVETTMSMIKAKFGGSVRAKLPTAQVNEVLLKVLCHNVVVLVQSIYELGLEPTFWE